MEMTATSAGSNRSAHFYTAYNQTYGLIVGRIRKIYSDISPTPPSILQGLKVQNLASIFITSRL